DLSGAPWVRPDGVPIVARAMDLASDKLLSSVSIGADGHDYGNYGFWSGAGSMGSVGDGGTSCNGWTSADMASKALGGAGGFVASYSCGPIFGQETFACGQVYAVGLLCLQE